MKVGVGGRVGVAGLSENKANLAQLGLKLGLSLAISSYNINSISNKIKFIK